MPTTVKVENWDGVTAPALPAVWVEPDGTGSLVTSTTHPRSGLNSLELPSGSGAQHTYIWADVATGINRDVIVSAWLYCETGLTTQLNFQLFARYQGGSGASTTFAGSSHYVAVLVFNGGAPGVYLYRTVSGTSTLLAGPSFSAAFAKGQYYRMLLSVIGTTVTVAFQRDSDGKWLDNTGTWVTDATGLTVCMTVTDSGVTTGGYGGLGFFASPATNAAGRVDDWQYDAVLGVLAAGTCFVRGNTATSLHIDSTPVSGGLAPYSYQVQRSTDGSSFSNLGSPQTGVGFNVAPSTVTDSGLTTGSIYYYRWRVTDSAASPATVTTNVHSFAPHASPATFYVDPAGSDSNAGTSAGAAWASLAHASLCGLNAGDTLQLKGGVTHAGNLLLMGVNGTYVSPFAIRGYGTGRPTVNPGNSYGVRLVNCSGIRLSGLTITGSGVTSGGVTTSTKCAVEIINMNPSGQLRGVRVDDLIISGTYSGVEVRGSAASPTGNCSGFDDVRITNVAVDQVAYNGVLVRGLVLIDQGGTALAWDAFDLVNTLGSTQNNYQLFKGLSGGRRPFQGVYVADCHVTNSYGDPSRTDPIHSGDGIMVKQARWGLVERCSAFDCGARGYGPAGIWIQEADDTVIRYCEVGRQRSRVDVDADGFDMDGGCNRCYVEYCYAHDCEGAGCLCGPYENSDPPADCVIRYCVFVRNCTKAGINAPAQIFPYQGAKLTVHNCVLYADASSLGCTALYIDSGGNPQALYNNILITDRADALRFMSGTLAGATFRGNLYFAFGAGGPKWNWNGVDYTTLAAFVAGAGQEVQDGVTVGQYADPLLRSRGDHPDLVPAVACGTLTAYDPGASSPALNAALDLLNLYGLDPGPIDFHGRAARAGADLTHAGADVGAAQSGSAGGGVLIIED